MGNALLERAEVGDAIEYGSVAFNHQLFFVGVHFCRAVHYAVVLGLLLLALGDAAHVLPHLSQPLFVGAWRIAVYSHDLHVRRSLGAAADVMQGALYVVR